MTTPPPIPPSNSPSSSGSHYASVLTTSVDQTIAIAASIASLLHSSDIIALTGELGSGKTQFVRGLAKGLGIDPRSVSSPTFILMTEYNSIQTNATLPLVHIDAYRIHGLSDLESVGWTDQIIAESVTAIEWADRITSQLPPDRLDITLEHQQENNQRRLIITTRGSWKQRYNSIIEILRDYQGFNAAGPVINSYTDNQENAVSTPKNPQKQLDSNLLPCPTCGKPVPTDSPISPFCSKRCRLIDLGKWLDGSYFTSRSINPDTDLQ